MPLKRIAVAVALAASVVVLATASSARAAGPPCPGVNAYLSDGSPSPTCAVMSPPLTLENRQPAILERKPAFGYYPATCIFVSHRWDASYNAYLSQQYGTINAAVRVVVDDGACTGATYPMYASLSITPSFFNVYGVGGAYSEWCRPGASGSGGVATVSSGSALCAGHTYAGIYDDWERGYYRIDMHVITGNGEWYISSTHQVF